MITSKLLIAILGPKYTEIKDDNSLLVCTEFGWQKFNGKKYPEGLNLHELANKCKIWAYENGYIISTEVACKDKFNSTVKSLHRSIVCLDSDKYEYEAIFKSGEFILNLIKDES